jgi:hypothetical protein
MSVKRKKCLHGKQTQMCKDCGGSGLCEHDRERAYCKECGGSQICAHGKERRHCSPCGGNQTCEHGKQRYGCKKCGVHRYLRMGGFSVEEIKAIGAVTICEFPGCLVQAVLQANGRQLNSDHAHDGNPINTENYRGEVCFGHNLLLGDLDSHPEWANTEAKEYMRRRPYSRH